MITIYPPKRPKDLWRVRFHPSRGVFSDGSSKDDIYKAIHSAICHAMKGPVPKRALRRVRMGNRAEGTWGQQDRADVDTREQCGSGRRLSLGHDNFAHW